jgi:flagellin
MEVFIMSMVVRTNSMAMNANSALNKNNSTVAGNLQKLSTGFRINRAADDASGLAVSEKMKAQIKALDQAGKNAQDGASLIKTAEGYMSEIHDMLNRVVELAEKSANGTYETTSDKVENYGAGNAGTDRQAIQDEVDQLTTEIDRIASTANFNQLKLLDGSLKDGYTLKAGVEGVEGQEAVTGSSVNGKFVYNAETKTYTSQTGEAQKDTAYKTVTPAELEGDFAANTTYYEKSGENYVETTDSTKNTEKTYYTLTVQDFTPEKVHQDKVDAVTAEDAVKGSALKLQIGETSGAADKLEVSIMSFKTADLFSALKDTKVNEEAGDDTSGINIVVANKSEAAKTAGFTKADDATEGYQGLTFNVSNQDAASKVAEEVRKVINSVSSQRATLGAMENRLDYTMNNLDTASQNITDANSRIRDTDMAKTMMQYTQGNTLTQAAQAMLAQANQAPSQVLQLLQ